MPLCFSFFLTYFKRRLKYMLYFVSVEPTDEKVVLKDSIVYLRNSKVVLVIKLKEETE